MLDETIITETPPLYSAYGWPGEPTRVPISGNRQKRILHGVINIVTGDVVLLITKEWNQDTHMFFLEMIRSHWRGWNIVLFEDRGTPHKAASSLELAAELKIEVRLLPRATPELNAMDHLWRYVKGRGLANRPTQSIEESADDACQYIYSLTRSERLRKAGVFSERFWLAGLP
jgi:transposase